jgi:PAS domain-containing protein
MFVEQTGVGIGWADIQATVKYLNPALTLLLGLDRSEEVYDQSVLKFYDPETISKLENTILTTVMDHGYWLGELPLKSKNGETRITLNV